MVEEKKRTKSNVPEKQQAKKAKLDLQNLKPSQTLYIKNLNDKINPKIIKHNLYLLFSTYGDIIDIKNNKRGQAHIIFTNVAGASLALKCLQDEEFFDKKLVINYAIKESKIVERARKEEEEIEG
ncbi:hypothetical protein G9P44_000008 [Scheffersomyces stipitis]|nr:hypothetical protein G9P44_000008 [Scheffersomyces stipitis]